MKIKKTDLTNLIKEELTAFYVTPDAFAKQKEIDITPKKQLQELKFVVKIAEVGTVVIDGKSEGDVRTRLIKKLRGGKKDIESITRIAKNKADRASKNLGIGDESGGGEPYGFDESAINEANPAQTKRMLANKIKRITKSLNIIKQSMGYIQKRYDKNPVSTKPLLFLSGIANKLEEIETSINEFPQKNFDPPSR